jgi:hypothetical protein
MIVLTTSLASYSLPSGVVAPKPRRMRKNVARNCSILSFERLEAVWELSSPIPRVKAVFDSGILRLRPMGPPCKAMVTQ